MFVKNDQHLQTPPFDWEALFSPPKVERLKQSSGYAFYELIFCNIYEEDFRVLYSEKYSAPNAAVNCLVGALLLMHQHRWSCEDMMQQIDFNVEVRVALGLRDFDERPFVERTLFNFKNRLAKHEAATGERLLEKVFDRLTKEQIEQLKVKTHIQRGDTVLLSSNIRSNSRLALLAEVVSRLERILSAEDRERFWLQLKPYVKGGEKYVYSVKDGTHQTHLERLGEACYALHTGLGNRYAETEAFQLFERAYTEHFQVMRQEGEDIIRIQLRPAKELPSNTLQSPDDAQATFRRKRNEPHQGFSALAVETCTPGNDLNLLTHVEVATNNTDDAAMLAGCLAQIKQKTPDLEEMHLDGGFGSEDVDKIAEHEQITIVQTAVKGVSAEAPLEIEGDERQGFTVTCANPEHEPVKAHKASKNYRADFDLKKCENCPFRDVCPTKSERKHGKGIAIWRFKPQDVLRQKRHKALQKIPKDRQTLRPGVEPAMRQMRRGEKNTGKLKVRGLFNFALYAFAMGIVVNFERIFRHFQQKNSLFDLFSHCDALWRTLCQRTCPTSKVGFENYKCVIV